MIVVKENTTSTGEVEKDEDDSSVTRPDEILKDIFSRANLELVRDLKQQKFPKELYQVKMYALQPKIA
jgi:protein N-terminal methyltransferase